MAQRNEALQQYQEALKQGRAYVKKAIARGEYPYPLALDDIADYSHVAARVNLGVINIPVDRIAGTKTAGRQAALSGSFMPLLDASSEFAAKWINLCLAHLDEGIRDPVVCFEYMGRFYIQEGNKRVSVLLSYGSRSIPATVTRLIPEYSESRDVQVYYEFLAFYQLSGSYEIEFRHHGQYARLNAALGMAPDHVWTDQERRSFSAGFSRFRDIFEKTDLPARDVLPSEALLVWLAAFTFQDIKDLSLQELTQRMDTLHADIVSLSEKAPIELSTEPVDASKNILSRLFNRPSGPVRAAFIYALDPEKNMWTRSHELGRIYAQEHCSDMVATTAIRVTGGDYFAAMKTAADDGCDVIFATTSPMADACRRIAAQYPKIKVFNCALSLPYPGIRSYYARIHECKFITGAIAGAMADNDKIGYIANYPIYGVPTGINAFALGARLTNPRAKIYLKWSCTAGNQVKEFLNDGVYVISNREAADPDNIHRALDWGTYKVDSDGALIPLALPLWDWGPFYERILKFIGYGFWSDSRDPNAINYWWGMNSKIIDVRLGDSLPYGIRSLAEMLRDGIISGRIDPFLTRIYDQEGTLRNDGTETFTAEQLMQMKWLADNVVGTFPPYYAILPQAQDIVRELGIYRSQIPPEEKEGVQV